MIDALMYGSSTSSKVVGQVRRRVHFDPLRFVQPAHAVRDVGCGHEQVEVELTLEPLSNDLHVQQPEEAAAEAEAERLRGLGLVEEGGVAQLQLLERVAQLGIGVGVGREEAREDHRLDVLVAGERRGCASPLRRQRVADAQLGDVLQPGDHVADFAGAQFVDRPHGGRHEADLLRLETGAERHRAQVLARAEDAVDDADERHDAAVLVVGRVEDERARRRVRVAGGRPDAIDDRVEHGVDALARLGGDPEDVLGVVADQVGDLDGGSVGIRCRQVDLVDDGDDLEVVLDREIGVRERLRLDALRGVDDEQSAFARLQAARHLVGEVDVAGRVDQVELVALPGDAHGLRLDRDSTLALEIHRIEQLVAHLARGDRLGELEDAIGERRLAVVDVRDDREVADVFLVHGLWSAARAPAQ